MMRITFGHTDRFAPVFGQERVAAVAPSLEDAYGYRTEAVEAETSRLYLGQNTVVRQVIEQIGNVKLLHLCFDADGFTELFIVVNRLRIQLKGVQDGLYNGFFLHSLDVRSFLLFFVVFSIRLCGRQVFLFPNLHCFLSLIPAQNSSDANRQLPVCRQICNRSEDRRPILRRSTLHGLW